MTGEPTWLSLQAVLAIHETLLAHHGGLEGLRDPGGLESSLASPRNHFGYGERSLFMLAAATALSLTKNHPFHDGNKRIALTAAGVFLELNGFRLVASEADTVSATLAISASQMSRDEFAHWQKTHCEPAR